MEKLLHGFSGSLHVLSAVTWIGSMIYSYFGVTPALKVLDPRQSHAISMAANRRFSPFTWTSLTLLVLTGTYAVVGESDKLLPLSKPAGVVLVVKLLLVAALVVILLIQAYAVSPQLKRLVNPAAPKDTKAEMQLNTTSRVAASLSGWHLAIGVIVILLGVALSQLLG